MKEILVNKIEEVIKSLDIKDVDFNVEHPTDISHGEWTTNVAMVAGNKEGNNPRELAGDIVSAMGSIGGVDSVEIAGPGFINFKLTHQAIFDSISTDGSKLCDGKKVLVEYTDPNPFKAFHIGHLMSNSIGEVIARLYELQGADVKRLSYGGDIGLHVAKTIWGMNKEEGIDMGEAYVKGNESYENDEKIKEEIDELNIRIYNHVVNGDNFEYADMYKEGKESSQKTFEEIYEILGTRFDKYYFESDVVEKGESLVKENIDNIFSISDGATIFDEEKSGLHTRVFINSKNIPTYETKELGLAYKKSEDFEYDKSIVITASEQTEYFKVVTKALEMINKELADKTDHVSHGMMRFADEKMSSRKGNVISGSSLLNLLIEEVKKKMEGREVSDVNKTSEQIAIAAVKFSILKQTPGKNIIFNKDESLSLEGDSGPYVQYAYTRAKRLIEKSKESGYFDSSVEITDLERILMKFNNVIDRAYDDLSPQYIVTYLLILAHEFNGFYQSNPIVGSDNERHYISIVQKVVDVIGKGLGILGVSAPEEM